MRRAPAAWAAIVTCVLALSAGAAFAQAPATYLYNLSSFSGPLRDDWARIRVDARRDETFVIYQNTVRVFNPAGMEFFSFGEDLDLGQILDLAVDGNGDLILLSFKDSRTQVTRCNFRGEPVGPIDISKVPDGVAFHANRMVLRNGLLYFASLAASTAIVTDIAGEFRRRIDLLPLMEPEDRQKGGTESIGFAVDEEGNVYFSVPSLFRVFKVSPDGRLAYFGRPGSVPGRFGIAAGIAFDSAGNVLVADKLKCVVMVFDPGFNFVGEFGYRGPRPENLVVPEDIAVDRQDRLYVSQGRRRGIGVFALGRR